MQFFFYHPQDADKYRLIYEGIHASDRGFRGLETRIIGQVLTKMETIGHYIEGSSAYELGKDGGTLDLTSQELGLLLDTLDAVPWKARVSRLAADTIDWLRGIDRHVSPA